jgi:bifunctional DNA-binding transcriptional regulator/antitoxin component of YhaV-PrlF toxin-antitoxin module
MTKTVTIDKSWRVRIPKAMRDELCLEPHPRFAVELHGDGLILHPIASHVEQLEEKTVL